MSVTAKASSWVRGYRQCRSRATWAIRRTTWTVNVQVRAYDLMLFVMIASYAGQHTRVDEDNASRRVCPLSIRRGWS